MKQYKNWALVMVGTLSLAGAMTSCEDQPEKFELTDGTPVIHYIRPQDAAAKDSLLTEAYTGTALCIVGENLTSVQQMYFNDKKAVLNSSYMTKNTLLVTIPAEVPASNTGKIYMVNTNKDTTAYDFKVLVPAPIVSSLKNEWVAIGDKATIQGQYFVNDPNSPLTIKFTGINNSTDITVPNEKLTITENSISFIVPEGAEEGQIEVTSIYGTGKSKFYFHDSRGIITDFDGPENGVHMSSSTNGIIPQGWNIAATYSSEDGVSGNYVQLGPVETEGGWAEGLKLPFWAGNWSGNPREISMGAGVPIRNVIDVSNWQNMSFKMELCIPSSNPWSAGALQIIFVSSDQCANDSWQNNIYIKTSGEATDSDKSKQQELKETYGKNVTFDLPRALYRPWASTGSYDTADEWVTITIPLTDFVYNSDGTKAGNGLSVDSFESLVIWPYAGGVAGTKCTPIFRYDNLRLVPNL